MSNLKEMIQRAEVDASSVDWDFNFDHATVNEMSFRYGSLEDIDLSNVSVEDTDEYVIINRNDIEDIYETFAEDQSKTAISDEFKYALRDYMTRVMHQPLDGAITVYSDDNRIKTLDHSEYVTAMVRNIIDYIEDNA